MILFNVSLQPVCGNNLINEFNDDPMNVKCRNPYR